MMMVIEEREEEGWELGEQDLVNIFFDHYEEGITQEKCPLSLYILIYSLNTLHLYHLLL